MSDDAKKEATKLKSALTRRVKKLIAQTLEPLGFTQEKDDKQGWTRTAEIMSHYCQFHYWNGYLVVDYGVGRVSRFDAWANAPQDAATQKKLKRFWKEHREQEDEGWVATAEQKTWQGPPKSEEEIEAILTGVEAFLRDEVTPYFRRFATVADVLREYDAGRLDKEFFDMDEEFWQDFYLALTRFHVGAYAEAAAAFEAAVEYIETSPDWDLEDEDDDMVPAVEAARIGADCMRRLVESQGKAGE